MLLEKEVKSLQSIKDITLMRHSRGNGKSRREKHVDLDELIESRLSTDSITDKHSHSARLVLAMRHG